MLVCPKCKTKNHGRANFCEACGKSLEALREADDRITEMLRKEARKGGWALSFVVVVETLGILITGAHEPMAWMLIVCFAILAVLAFRVPMVPAAIGLALYGVVHLLAAVVEPATIIQGVIMKVIVVGVLVGAIRSGLRYRAFQRERGLV